MKINIIVMCKGCRTGSYNQRLACKPILWTLCRLVFIISR